MTVPRPSELSRTDKLLVLGLLGYGVIEWSAAVADDGYLARPAATLAAVVVIALMWAWRPRHALLVPFGAVAAITVADPVSEVSAKTAWSVAVVLVAAVALGIELEGRRLARYAAAFYPLGLSTVLVRGSSAELPEELIWATAGIIVALAGGRVIGSSNRLSRELRAQNQALAQERELLARAAVADERARIARELHDVVAHSVSVMVVQAGAARRIAPRDRGQAAGAFGAIESTGRSALAEMRRLLGVLQPGDSAARPAGIDRVAELVERSRAAGLPVRLQVEGHPCALTEDAGLIAFRVVQEGLTNVLKHAGPAATTVTVRWDPEGVDVAVENESGRATGIGGAARGLAGMRERVEACGGELRAGPQADGGFAVRARIPAAVEAVA